ncbi:MAG: hypothetical protein WCV82_02745 [Candidatus Paceibacterota bacterium]
MTQYKIVNGPSKHDLDIAFINRINGKRLPVEFWVEGLYSTNPNERTNVCAVINSLSWEDGSGESWNFEGYVTCHDKEVMYPGKIKGQYWTSSREGIMTISQEVDGLNTIIVSKRSDDYHAQLAHYCGAWDCGKTADEAIGALIRTHSKKFGIKLESS